MNQKPASAALRHYVEIIVAIGSVIVVYSLAGAATTPRPLAWWLFAALAVVTGSFRLKIASLDGTISVSDTFFITSALLFGPATATVLVAVDSFAMSCRRRQAWDRIGFNSAAPALSMWAAAHAFFYAAGVQPLAQGRAPVGPLILPLACLAVIYFGLNSGLMAVAVGLDARQSPLQIWRRHFQWLSIGYLASASVAYCLVLLIQEVNLAAIFVILPVLAVFHLTLRSSYGRLEDAHRHMADVDRLYRSTVETLAMAIDAKDDVTHSHVRRVQAYAMALARALEITDEPTLKAIEAAALLHDTGKLAVPEHILNKPGKLTPPEFDQMKLHVDVGADILSLVEFPYPVVPIVRCHHENWDGTGYPRGVSGEDIPIGARILSVVDCFDALTSDRPYRRRMSDEASLDILRERRGRMYDPRVVDMFIGMHRDVVVTNEGPAQRHVMARISGSRQAEAVPSALPAAGSAASDDVLAFVSIARLAAGEATLSDVLALSSNLVRNIVPAASGAWYVVDAARGELVAIQAFGAAASALRGASVRAGERLTGWVAANRQTVVNSDAALDLDDHVLQMAPRLQSCMSAPLMTGDALIAVLTLYAADRDVFTEDLGRLVQMIAPHIARAIAVATARVDDSSIIALLQ